MRSENKNFNLNQYIKGILSGDRATLSRAITLRESTLPEHKLLSEKLLKSLIKHTGNSIRIGVTGIPGAGKSTFIDIFGSYLIEKFNKKVAVLAVDPSSHENQGSILGDKTRMEHLSRQDSAFIRPSPNKTILGGVNQHTRESMLFCEAAGYDIILIETVGVGQSEAKVHEMVDFLVMLQIVGGGDDLQAIKKGIYEKIDLILIHKADQNNKIEAEVEKEKFFKNFALFPKRDSGWHPRAQTCSSIEKTGINEVWNTIAEFEKITRENDSFFKNRKSQNSVWFHHLVANNIRDFITNQSDLKIEIKNLQNQIQNDEINSIEASERITETLKKIFGQV